VWHQDRQIVLSGPKQRALLAVLLLHAKEVVPGDRLIEELWPGEPVESAANSLRVNISRLRKALPGDVLATRAPGYVIRLDSDQLDLHRFERLVDDARGQLAEAKPAAAAERLREALSLWRGPALVDFAYESFAQAAISRLEEIRLAALELRIEVDLALGRDRELIGELEALVAEHPLRERLRGHLMTALYRSGRQAEALDTYQDGRSALIDQLGIEPSPALHELQRAILRQDPTLDAPRTAQVRWDADGERSILMAVPDESRLDVELLLVDAPDELVAEGVPDEQLGAVLVGAPCDVALLVPREATQEGAVLVPFGGSDHDWAAVELGAWFSRASGVPLRLAGAAASPEGGRRDASRLLSHASLAVQRALGVSAEPLLVDAGQESMLAASRDASLLVVGLSTSWEREGLGLARLRLAREASAPTLLVRCGLRPGGLAPPATLTRFTWSIRI
jgi:DNA-binding SARP family transcriptional activator